MAFSGDFGVKIFCRLWKDEPDSLFHGYHIGEKVLCVKWSDTVPDLLAYGSEKGIMRILHMDNNKEFQLAHTFRMDEKGEAGEVLSLSWDASNTYLLASLSSDKIGVIHRISKARWIVLDPIVISGTPTVRSILISSVEPGSPFFVVAPSYSSTLELWSRSMEGLLTGDMKMRWKKICHRNTGGVVTTMCAFYFQKQDLIATAEGTRTVDVWQILHEDRFCTPNHASLVHLASHTLSGGGDSYIEKITWIRGSLGVNCSDGFIYHLKVHRLPGKIKGEVSYFTCKESCKLNQECGFSTTCIKFDPKKKYECEHLATGGTHGFIYLWNLHTVPYLLALESRERDWEIDYYSVSNAAATEGGESSSSIANTGNVKEYDNLSSIAPAAEGDSESRSRIDSTDNVKQHDNLNSMLKYIRDVLLPESNTMEKSLSDAKDRWLRALNHLKDVLEDSNCSISELKGALEELEKVRKDIETAAGKAKFAYEG